MSPEMIEMGMYTAASDMYAYGIMVWEICACKIPYENFKTAHQLNSAVVRGVRPEVDGRWAEEARKLMAACWEGDAEKRPTADSVVKILKGVGKEMTHQNDETKDMSEEVKAKYLAASRGDADAQLNLGNCCYNGQGVRIDFARAVDWYEKAAAQGDAMVQSNLGVCYANGQGVKQDFARAVYWYEKAAAQGHASAQYNLGVTY
jgi:TPR repeat protein